MNSNGNTHYDEFYWERIFARDDRKLKSCMREIPAIIDLPEEDKLLEQRLIKTLGDEAARNITEYIKAGNVCYFDTIFFPEDWRERQGAFIYIIIERMMREWAAFYALDLDEKYNDHSVCILCLYGNLMKFAVDLININKDRNHVIRTALCKRIHAGINKILAVMRRIECSSPSFTAHRTALKTVRQKVLNLRFET